MIKTVNLTCHHLSILGMLISSSWYEGLGLEMSLKHFEGGLLHTLLASLAELFIFPQRYRDYVVFLRVYQTCLRSPIVYLRIYIITKHLLS